VKSEFSCKTPGSTASVACLKRNNDGVSVKTKWRCDGGCLSDNYVDYDEIQWGSEKSESQVLEEFSGGQLSQTWYEERQHLVIREWVF